LVELTVVLAVSGLTLGLASLSFGGYLQRTSAQQGARVFARDLALARGAALRTQQPVVIRFDEESRWYSVTLQQSGTELVRRRFGPGGDIGLSSLELSAGGDSLRFDARGLVDLTGMPANGNQGGASVGSARFASGAAVYAVLFNAMGASRIEGP
jgi:type II secretory pathway pseudopilin PulG